MKNKLRLTRQEFSHYKSLDIDGKAEFIRGRAKAKSKEFVENVGSKQSKIISFCIALFVVVISAYFSHLYRVLNLGIKDMNEYVYCVDCKTYHRASSTHRYQVTHLELGANIFDMECVCPNCGSSELEEAGLCCVCESPTTHSVLCEECMKDLVEMFGGFTGEIARKWHISQGEVKDIVEEVFGEL